MTSVLMVLTAADHWTLRDGSTHPTGFWAEEFLVPYQVFTDAGWEITVATPGGVRPTVDDTSLGVMGGLPHTNRRRREELERLAPVLDHPASLEEVEGREFDVVFYPGGHGPMEDLAYDATSAAILTAQLESGRPVALLCHSPAAVVATADDAGRTPFAGYRMTGLSNREELGTPASRKAKWLLEDKLVELGIDYDANPVPFRPHVIQDRNVYSGQNPQSSEDLARLIVAERNSQPE